MKDTSPCACSLEEFKLANFPGNDFWRRLQYFFAWLDAGYTFIDSCPYLSVAVLYVFSCFVQVLAEFRHAVISGYSPHCLTRQWIHVLRFGSRFA